MSAIVRLGDMQAIVAEGSGACLWRLGVTGTGKELVLSHAAWRTLPVNHRVEPLVPA